MNKIAFILILMLGIRISCVAQSDSLDVFRTPTKNNANAASRIGVSGNNAISISIGHLGRGGTMLTYERYINNTPFSVFAGFGFTKIDYIGQYSLDEERFYYASIYTERKNVDVSSMFDVGAKYMLDEELGGAYFGLCFSNYNNSLTQQVKDYYEVPLSDPRVYKLNYTSKEFKLIYGITNDVSERFYSDFFIGAGFRIIDYQQLQIQEVPVVNNANLYAYTTELLIDKDSKNEFKPWLFFGWKIGVRF